MIVLLGVFSLSRLPVNSYPALTPPQIQVQAVYPGATAQDVATAVAAPIEQQLSGLDGLLYFKSSNSSDGIMNLSIYFDVSRDPNLAAVDVQNQIALAEPQLPQEVVRNGISVQKAQTSILVAGALTSDDPRFDAQYLSNYSKLYVEDELKRLPGVGDAQTVGQLEFSMLLSLDPDRMARLRLTVADVAAAVQEQNATNPAGRIGREPSPPGTQLTIPVVTAGRLKDPADVGRIIVRAQPNGSLVRVSDIGETRLGAQNYDVVGRLDGKPAAMFLVFLRPGANALQVKQAVVRRMGELATSFPAGVRWSAPFDTTPYITASIREVVTTLFEAMLLVTLVVFVFLQSWRATLIPVLAVPVSVIGAFFGMEMLGFSINLLTLFGLVLAIGIVVDDAIVVIENVERIMATEGVSPAVAADRAMHQVSRALIAIVLVLCAVFIPVAFSGGITGLMYRQFAVTIAIAVVLSGIVALTLTPALCAVLLRPPSAQAGAGKSSPLRRFFARFNGGVRAVTDGYVGAAGRVINRPRTFFAAFGVVVVLLVVLMRAVPSGFIPSEDKGYFAMLVQLPDDASRQRTEAVVSGVEGFLKQQPAIAHVVSVVGLNFIENANQTNAAVIFVSLKPWGERASQRDQINAVLGATNGYLFGVREARGFAFNMPEIIGLGTTAGLEMNLQDPRRERPAAVRRARQRFHARSERAPGAAGRVLDSASEHAATLRRGGPGEVQGARDLAHGAVSDAPGVPLDALHQRLQPVWEDVPRAGGGAAEVPPDAGRHRPPVCARPRSADGARVGSHTPGVSDRAERADSLQRLYVCARAGRACPGDELRPDVSRRRAARAGQIRRTGRGLRLERPVLSGAGLGRHRRACLRTRPRDGVPGALVVGLAAKNAILIVEFANELRTQGRTIREAALEAGRERLRPILMTSFAFILGVVPLLVSSGAGAASRHSIGTGVFFGMLVATAVGIFFIPLFFVVIRALSERALGRRATRGAAASVAPAPVPGD